MTAVLDSPGAKDVAAPSVHTCPGSKHTDDQMNPDPEHLRVIGAQLDDDQACDVTQRTGVVVEQSGPAVSASDRTTPMSRPRSLLDPLLILAAEALDDLESARIANENRLRSLRDVYGLAGTPQEAGAAALVDGLAALEHQAELELKRALRRHPLGPWVKATVGVGEKQGARLLAAIGDPYWNSLHDRPRTVSELWSYCGYHVLRAGGNTSPSPLGTHSESAGVAPARARGQKSNWSGDGRMRTWLVAGSCIKKARSPYRPVYDAGRQKYADAGHTVDCKRCGPSGKPALAGSPLSAGHQHARALRLVSKAILRDLWIAARTHHEGEQQA